ncbi:GNAT family N-acetyltransferase [Falsiroseomonas sp. E2-1-a20]|uniref:GNAT family N-acetyltransferase n=1 Tax=Falsiroseomonas sp. E2-1-a20 TaxID=3239300 RepID=UPI003F31CF92
MIFSGIRQVATDAEARAFHALPARLRGLGWSVPLAFEEARMFDPARFGFLADHRVMRFVAYRYGLAVGRIAACVPDDATAPATFGFLCAEQDAALVAALLAAARQWVAGQGRAEMLGPLSFTINHEVGAQVGFHDRPPMLRMPGTPDWLPAMLEAAGLEPAQDVVACTLDVAAERHSARFAALAIRRAPDMARLRLRPMDRRHYAAEVERIAALYNDAWAANWGAVPLRPAEVAGLGALLRPLLWAGEVVFAEWDREPVGLVAVVPNLAAAMLADGRLLPFGWVRLAGALAGRVGSARIPMLGIASRFRGHPASALAMGALLREAIGIAGRRGWNRLEISWILADNAAMRNAMARLPAPVSGRWRIWRMRF